MVLQEIDISSQNLDYMLVDVRDLKHLGTFLLQSEPIEVLSISLARDDTFRLSLKSATLQIEFVPQHRRVVLSSVLHEGQEDR